MFFSFARPPERQLHLNYRPDIDGLRALAIAMVVGFHAFPDFVPGGFVGVDVFFVISGFLISGLILANLRVGIFSFLGFYERRIKRIFPALILVMFACFVFGWFVLLADEYQQLGKHIAGGAAFVSNFVLWKEKGYFDNSVYTKPLMHLWSLGVEEQFYIVWPFLAWLAYRLRFNLFIITAVIAALSFIDNVIQIGPHQNMAFYSPQTRLWELMLGAMLAAFLSNKNEKPGTQALCHRINILEMLGLYRRDLSGKYETVFYNIQSLLGLSFVVVASYLITNDKAFPGWWALLPTLGALLMIASGRDAWLNRVILSKPVFLWLGLISYPLYLWHWPLLSFLRITQGKVPAAAERFGAVFLAVILADLTRRLIERPIRFGRAGGRKALVLCVFMLTLGCLGYESYLHHGFQSIHSANFSFNASQLEWNDRRLDECSSVLGIDTEFCMIYGDRNNIQAAVIGDSTANALAPGLAKLYPGLINFGASTCPPLRGMINTKKTPDCPKVANKTYDYVDRTESIKIVVLGFFGRDLQFWGLPGTDENTPLQARLRIFRKMLNDDIEDLKRHGKKVIVTYDAPDSPVAPRDCVARPFSPSRKKCGGVLEKDLYDRQPYLSFYDDFFKDRTDVCVLRQSALLVPNGRLAIFDGDGKLLLRDQHHLSYYGSDQIATLFKSLPCLTGETFSPLNTNISK